MLLFCLNIFEHGIRKYHKPVVHRDRAHLDHPKQLIDQLNVFVFAENPNLIHRCATLFSPSVYTTNMKNLNAALKKLKGSMWETVCCLFIGLPWFLGLPDYHTLAAAVWVATVCSFQGDRLIIMGCGTPSSPLYGPDVRQRLTEMGRT